MSDMREDAEALADVLRRLDGEGFNWSYLGSNDLNTDDGWRDVEDLARAVLVSDWLAAHDAQVRAEALAPIEALDDYVCGALMAAKHGSYDGRSVESHLERLLDKVRAAMEAKG